MYIYARINKDTLRFIREKKAISFDYVTRITKFKEEKIVLWENDESGKFPTINQAKSNPQKCLHSADCHLCADVCPMGAIDPSDITRIPGICIKCGACTKKCPAQAMYFDDPGYLYHKSELEDLYRRRADNAFFL